MKYFESILVVVWVFDKKSEGVEYLTFDAGCDVHVVLLVAEVKRGDEAFRIHPARSILVICHRAALIATCLLPLGNVLAPTVHLNGAEKDRVIVGRDTKHGVVGGAFALDQAVFVEDGPVWVLPSLRRALNHLDRVR